MSIEKRPEFQVGLKKLKDNFREALLDGMSNDEGIVGPIWDDASAQVPDELFQLSDRYQLNHLMWQEALVRHLEVWVEQQLQTEVKDET